MIVGSASRRVRGRGAGDGSAQDVGGRFSRTTPLYGLRSALTLMISPVRVSRLA